MSDRHYRLARLGILGILGFTILWKTIPDTLANWPTPAPSTAMPTACEYDPSSAEIEMPNTATTPSVGITYTDTDANIAPTSKSNRPVAANYNAYLKTPWPNSDTDHGYCKIEVCFKSGQYSQIRLKRMREYVLHYLLEHYTERPTRRDYDRIPAELSKSTQQQYSELIESCQVKWSSTPGPR